MKEPCYLTSKILELFLHLPPVKILHEMIQKIVYNTLRHRFVLIIRENTIIQALADLKYQRSVSFILLAHDDQH